MKALIYKEFKLAMHPICYIFIACFPLMVLIPSYPLAVGFIYVLSCYPILFLGANKGQQSNDLLYSVLLPVRKKDIVLARIITVIFMQLAFIAIMSLLYPLALSINISIENDPTANVEMPGFGLQGYVSVLAIAIIGYAIADLIFFSVYYKNGKAIVSSTLLTILGFVMYLGVFTIALPLSAPYIPGMGWFNPVFNTFDYLWAQFILLGVALIISVILHFIVYKVSSKRLENVDF